VAHSRPAMSIDLSPAADASHSIIR
jgi:hypothetical protein